MHIADGAVAADIMNRKVEFPKPIHVYKVLDLLGKNVLTVEGADHRKHRKVASPTFSDKNNGYGFVFSEAGFD
jgi:cytochrome P450